MKCDQDHLGFILNQDKESNRGFIHDIIPTSTASEFKSWKRKYSGSYITRVNQIPVFTKEDIEQEFSKVREGSSKPMPPILHLVLAPDKMKTDTAGIPQIQIDQLRTVVQNICDLNKEEHIIDNLTDDKIVLVIKGQTAMKSIGQNPMPQGAS
eukprot:912740-Ditylum_brightwellii.AAC.1